MPTFQHCVIAFSHIYDRAQPERCFRDYDNLELKQIQDVIGSFVLTDDSGALCDTYHTTELGIADCTRVSIMDKERFPVWLTQRKGV